MDAQKAPPGTRALPLLLLTLTIVTGLVDAVSYLALGHVFVANMTGNVVFLGFAAAGAQDVSAPASAAAVGAFLLGSFVGGALSRRNWRRDDRLLPVVTGLAAALMAPAALIAALAGDQLADGSRYAVIALLASAMGMQNAMARRLGVRDLTTTVLTMTLTGLANDARLGGGPGAPPARRLASVVTMFTGALLGGLLTLGVGPAAALAVAFALLAATALLGLRA